MNEPMISVIVPVYKAEEYLKDCVDSILAQSYKNLEIILVDDGSPDECPKMCDEYAKINNRIKVIHKENGGSGDARNFGLDIASGEWFCIVDSDDVIHRDYVKILFDTALKSNADIAMCIGKPFIEEFNINDVLPNAEIKEFSKIQAIKESIINAIFIVPWNRLYRKTVFADVRYPKWEVHDDNLTTYKTYFNANKVAFIPLNLYFYRQRQNSSLSHTNREKSLKDYRKGYREMLEISNKKLGNSTEEKLLRDSIICRLIRSYVSSARHGYDFDKEKFYADYKKYTKYTLSFKTRFKIFAWNVFMRLVILKRILGI